MTESEYKLFRSAFAAVMKQNPHTCKAGYTALMRTKDMESLARVIRRYWPDLNNVLWPQFQHILHNYWPSIGPSLSLYGISYNQNASSGLAVCDEYADEVHYQGEVDITAHANARLVAYGQCRVVLLDESHAVTDDACSVDVRQSSSVIARGRTKVRAFDDSHVESDGFTTLYLYDNCTAHIIHYYRLQHHDSVTFI